MRNLSRMKNVPFYMARFCLSITVAVLVMFNVNIRDASAVTYDAWNVECKPRSDNAENMCIASQSVTTENKKQVIIGVLVAYMPEHPLPHIIFRVTPSANVDKGAAVKVDEQAYFNVPISNCDKNICEIRSFMPEELLAQMRKGNSMKFAFFVEDKQFVYPISLKGFEQVYTALKASSE